MSNTALIAPPFNFNAPNVSTYSPEVTGRIVLNSMCSRLGWPSLAGKRILDFGCGVRFARTIINLEMPVGFYAGVDANAESIAWLKENVADSHFWFDHVNMKNAMYNPAGENLAASALTLKGLTGFDVACMFSVITHQNPKEAGRIFRMLRPCAARLYFTAFVDDSIEGYVENAPESPGLKSTYSTRLLTTILRDAGWRIEAQHPHVKFQQPVFICV